MVGLNSLKTQYGLSGNSVTRILNWVKGLLPKENTLPNSYPVMKNSLKGLGMNYKSIHACVYVCILYRKEYVNLDWYPLCDEPRYVQFTGKEGTISNLPQKVLKYFPVGPGCMNVLSCECMTWWFFTLFVYFKLYIAHIEARLLCVHIQYHFDSFKSHYPHNEISRICNTSPN